MQGLRSFFGNPVSEHADRNLDLVGIGRLLALSTRRELNSLACVRYRPEFGANRVVYLGCCRPRADEASRTDFAQQLCRAAAARRPGDARAARARCSTGAGA